MSGLRLCLRLNSTRPPAMAPVSPPFYSGPRSTQAEQSSTALSRCHVLSLPGKLVLLLLPGMFFLPLLLFLKSQFGQHLVQGAPPSTPRSRSRASSTFPSLPGAPSRALGSPKPTVTVTWHLPVACLVPSCHPGRPAVGLAPSKRSESVGGTAGNADGSSYFS